MTVQIMARVKCDCETGIISSPEATRYWNAQRASDLSVSEWIKQNPDEFDEEIPCPKCEGTSWVQKWVSASQIKTLTQINLFDSIEQWARDRGDHSLVRDKTALAILTLTEVIHAGLQARTEGDSFNHSEAGPYQEKEAIHHQ